MFNEASDYANLELSLDDLDLVLGGDAPEPGTHEAQPNNSGGFMQSLGNVSNAGQVGAIAGGVVGGGLGALGGSFAGPAGTAAGAVGGAEIGAFAGGALAAGAMATYESYQAGIVDSFQQAAAEYQANPPPI